MIRPDRNLYSGRGNPGNPGCHLSSPVGRSLRKETGGGNVQMKLAPDFTRRLATRRASAFHREIPGLRCGFH